MTEAPRIACIILAAGRSTRMGEENKLLAVIGGKPMLRHVAEAALASRASPVLLVTGHQGPSVEAAVAGLDIGIIPNADFAAGLSTSLKAGIRAVPDAADGALVLLGDMPQITSAHLDRLIAAFGEAKGMAIVVPTRDGLRGNPVLWPRACFAQMLQLEGDAGAKRLMAAHADQVREVDLGTDAIFADIDTPEALARARSSPGAD